MAEAYVRASLRFVSAIYEWVKLCLVMWNILQFFSLRKFWVLRKCRGWGTRLEFQTNLICDFEIPSPCRKMTNLPQFSLRAWLFFRGLNFLPILSPAACFLIKKNCHRTANVPTQNIVILAPFLRSDFCFDRWRHTQQVAYDNLWTLS